MPKLELPTFDYNDDPRSFADKLNELVRQLEYGINREKSPTLINFNNRNDRNSNIIMLPTIAGDGTAIDHIIATDGSATISLEWGWTGNNADIDGWIVYVHQSTTGSEYNFGDSPATELSIEIPSEKRACIFPGMSANQYYTFGIQAYRKVDPDVNANGIIVTAIVKPTAIGENPYQPSANVVFQGDIQGTINGTAASTITTVATNFNTRNDRISVTPADPVIARDSYTKSLLHMNGTNGSTTFTDETGKVWTAHGNAQISTAQSKFGGSSGLFDGTGDYIDTPDHEDFNVGSGDFTGDCWIYPTDAANVGYIFGQTNTSGYCPAGLLFNAGHLMYAISTTGTGWLATDVGTTEVTINTWHHVAFVRNGSVFTVCLDGVQELTYTSSATLYDSTDTFKIGRSDYAPGLYYFNGYIAEFRFSKGIARYTTDFAVPTSPYTDGTAIDHTINTDGSADISCEWEHDGVGDEYNIDGFNVYVHSSTVDWNSSTSLLLHMDGTNDGTTFTDEAGKTVTVNGNVVTKTGIKKFGTASGYFPGNVGDYLSIADSDDFNISSGDFTIHFWGYNLAGADGTVIQLAEGIFGSSVGYVSGGNLVCYLTSTGTNWDVANARSMGAVPGENWVHYALIRSGNNFYTARGGTIISTWTSSASIYLPVGNLIMGKYKATGGTDYYLSGYIDEPQILKGIALWTSNFTPPTRLSTVGYNFGLKPSQEQKYSISSEKRAFILPGVAANRYYTFGIQAYRMVDPDVNANGIIESNIVKSTVISEDPYQPSSSVAFLGDVSGTVSGNVTGSVDGKTVDTINIISPSNTGNGSDGAFNSVGNVTFTSTLDGDPIVKQYTSFTLNTGHTMTVSNRCKGLIIYSQGDVTINGTISMDDKAARVTRDTSSLPWVQSCAKINYFDYTAKTLVDFLLPAGGSGGNGGFSAGSSSPGTGGSNCAYGGAGGGGGEAYETAGNNGGVGGGTGGTGGAGYGGGGAGSNGGAGGGGIIIIVAKGNITINASGVITAKSTQPGGNGGNTTAGGQAGGGGGGAGNGGYGGYGTATGGYDSMAGAGGGGAGGGVVCILYGNTYTNSGSINVNGSAGGSGGTATGASNNQPGGNGQAGSAGSIFIVKAVTSYV